MAINDRPPRRRAGDSRSDKADDDADDRLVS